MEAYSNRQLTTQEALKKLLELAESEAQREEKQKDEGISSVAWFIREVLHSENVTDMRVVKDLESIVTAYPDFARSDRLTRDLRNDLFPLQQPHPHLRQHYRLARTDLARHA